MVPPNPEFSCSIDRRLNPIWKQLIDLCGAVVVAVLLTPLLVLAAVYIKLVSPGPVLFVQSRVGFGGENFRIYKFRTMRIPEAGREETHRDYIVRHSGVDGPIKKPDYQSELIPGGEWLRRFSIDELPQLLNVMQGNMSLVGPRPDILRLDDYKDWQLRRFEVLPGMTGLWQVSGKNRLTFEQMVELDIEYVETRSLSRDLLIMAKTVMILLLEHNE